MTLSVCVWRLPNGYWFEGVRSEWISNEEDFSAHVKHVTTGSALPRTPGPVKRAKSDQEVEVETPELPVYNQTAIYGEDDVGEATGIPFTEWLESHWPEIVAYVSHMHVWQEQSFETHSTSLGLLRSELGQRGAQDSDPSMWGAIRNLYNAVSESTKPQGDADRITQLERRCSTLEGRFKTLKSRFTTFMERFRAFTENLTTKLGPPVQFTNRYTAPGEIPGGLLDEHLHQLGGILGTAPAGTGGQAPLVTQDHHELLASELKDLSAQLNATRKDVDRVMARVGQHQVSLCGYTFQSRDDVENWKRKVNPGFKFGYFFDVISLLEVLNERSNSGGLSARVTQEYQARRTSYSCELEAYYCVSFQSCLPSVFGKLSDSTLHAGEILPAMKTFDEWDPQDSTHRGIKHWILHSIDNQHGSVMDAIKETCLGCMEMNNVCQQMLGDSILFFRSLAHFVSEFTIELN